MGRKRREEIVTGEGIEKCRAEERKNKKSREPRELDGWRTRREDIIRLI